MKMKKYMAVALAAMLLALTGCGNTNDSSSVSDVPASTKAATESAETTTTTVESTTVETTTTEATEPDESADDSMAFADMADAIDKAMSAHMNDPADTADDMLKLCRATIEDLKANGLPLGEYTGDTETSGLDENGESHGEHTHGKVNTVSAIVCKMPTSALGVSDIEGITLEEANSFRMISTDSTGTIDGYSVTLRFNIDDPKNAVAALKAYENIFSYFVENGYVDVKDSGYNVPIKTAVKYAQTQSLIIMNTDDCGCTVKDDNFRITILPKSADGICDISFNKL